MELWVLISRAPPLWCLLANSFWTEQYFTKLLIGIDQLGVVLIARNFGVNQIDVWEELEKRVFHKIQNGGKFCRAHLPAHMCKMSCQLEITVCGVWPKTCRWSYWAFPKAKRLKCANFQKFSPVPICTPNSKIQLLNMFRPPKRQSFP